MRMHTPRAVPAGTRGCLLAQRLSLSVPLTFALHVHSHLCLTTTCQVPNLLQKRLANLAVWVSSRACPGHTAQQSPPCASTLPQAAASLGTHVLRAVTDHLSPSHLMVQSTLFPSFLSIL